MKHKQLMGLEKVIQMWSRFYLSKQSPVKIKKHLLIVLQYSESAMENWQLNIINEIKITTILAGKGLHGIHHWLHNINMTNMTVVRAEFWNICSWRWTNSTYAVRAKRCNFNCASIFWKCNGNWQFNIINQIKENNSCW